MFEDGRACVCTNVESESRADEAEGWVHDLDAVAVSVNGTRNARKTIEATYTYTDEQGSELFRVVRFDGKRFKQQRKVGTRWVDGLGDTRRVLYRLPEVVAAVRAGHMVYVCEGEKDVDALRQVGVVATCNPMGAGKWSDEFSEFLRGANAVVVQDKDDKGRTHAREVARSLAQVASSVRVVEALTGKDASDHLEAGHTVDEFREVRLARAGVIDGGSFILDAPTEVPCVWGRGDECLWSQGESFFVVGPQGVGKSTLVQQLALARIGLNPTLLDLPVTQDDRPSLYLAIDRSPQIARSFRRMVSDNDRQLLSERLIVWQGPLPFNVTSEHEKFAPFVQEFDVGTVFIDSLKDIALDLSKDEAGSRVNAALQETLACGIEVVVVHHQRKAQANNKKPTTLSDVYGSTFITAGAGSVVLLWGAPGDPIVEVSHLKQPAAEFGPLMVIHDHAHGRTEVQPEFDVRVVLKAPKGLTVRQAAEKLFGTDAPDRNQVEKARRKLDGLVAQGEARRTERERESGGRPEAIYYVEGDLT